MIPAADGWVTKIEEGEKDVIDAWCSAYFEYAYNLTKNPSDIIKYDSSSITYILHEICFSNMYNLLAPWIITATIRP